LSLVLFKLPIRPRLSLGTFVGNVYHGLWFGIVKRFTTFIIARDV